MPPSFILVVKVIFPNKIPILDSVVLEYGTPSEISIYLGIILIVSSLFFHCVKEIGSEKKSKFALYQQGLNNTLEQGFLDVVNKRFSSPVITTKIDITRFNDRGIITSPKDALDEINGGIENLIRNVNNSNNKSELLYGGLISVPFSFYTGMELDDRYPITVLDYDRTEQKWKEIDRVLLSESPNILIENNGNYQGESVVVASISYPINEKEVEQQFSGIPISRIQVGNIDKDNHWDIEFQKELQNEFLDLVKKLGASGCHTIHLILAAQNSVSFNLGRCYDNRNLPSVIVYQYEKGNEIKYPWGLKMKTSGIDKAEIIHN